MRFFLSLILPLAVCSPSLASAQNDDENQTVCVGTPQWRPTLAEGVAIEAAPVPSAFRGLYESREPCLEYRYNAQLLAEWHLRFGSERSFAAGLAYAERNLLRRDPPPAGFRAAVHRAWRDEQPVIARGEEPPRLDALMEARERYVFLATLYLRAAEEFSDRALLDKAETYLRAAAVGPELLTPVREEPAFRSIYPNLHIYLADDLEMRAAVLRAALTRAPADIARAESVVQASDRPFFRPLAERAFSGGNDFCDIGSGYGQAEQLEESCRAADESNDLQARVVNQLLSRAMLDLVADKEEATGPDSAGDIALRLLDLERLPDRGRCCGRPPVDDIVRLRIARAQYFSRRLMIDGRSSDQNWHSALTDLEAAERLIPPYEAPTRTRRIARAWLALWGRGGSLFSREAYDDRDLPTNAPVRQRYASYLRHLLADLETITAGLPPRAN